MLRLSRLVPTKTAVLDSSLVQRREEKEREREEKKEGPDEDDAWFIVRSFLLKWPYSIARRPPVPDIHNRPSPATLPKEQQQRGQGQQLPSAVQCPCLNVYVLYVNLVVPRTMQRPYYTVRYCTSIIALMYAGGR